MLAKNSTRSCKTSKTFQEFWMAYLRASMRFLQVPRQVSLLGRHEVTQLALELLQHRLRVILRDVASQRVFCQSPVEALSALVLEELKSKI